MLTLFLHAVDSNIRVKPERLILGMKFFKKADGNGGSRREGWEGNVDWYHEYRNYYCFLATMY